MNYWLKLCLQEDVEAWLATLTWKLTEIQQGPDWLQNSLCNLIDIHFPNNKLSVSFPYFEVVSFGSYGSGISSSGPSSGTYFSTVYNEFVYIRYEFKMESFVI